MKWDGLASDVFVVEHVDASGRVELWTVAADSPEAAAEAFDALKSGKVINRILFDTGWHRTTEMVDSEPGTPSGE